MKVRLRRAFIFWNLWSKYLSHNLPIKSFPWLKGSYFFFKFKVKYCCESLESMIKKIKKNCFEFAEIPTFPESNTQKVPNTTFFTWVWKRLNSLWSHWYIFVNYIVVPRKAHFWGLLKLDLDPLNLRLRDMWWPPSSWELRTAGRFSTKWKILEQIRNAWNLIGSDRKIQRALH